MNRAAAPGTKFFLVNLHAKGRPIIDGPFDDIETASRAWNKYPDKDKIAMQRRTADGKELGAGGKPRLSPTENAKRRSSSAKPAKKKG